MREILFRGKRVDNGEWVESRSIDCWNENEIWLGDVNKNGGDQVQVIPETVGQHTGLTDENGDKIFEGDILKDTQGWVYEVKWDSKDARFLGYHRKPRGETYICYVNKVPKSTIIGNIHDNPELLEEEKC